MRLNELLEREIDLTILGLAAGHAPLRQISLYGSKQFRVGPVGNTQEIIEALHGRSMHIGKCRQRYRDHWTPDILLVHVGGTLDQLAGVLLAEPQQDIGSKLIGSVFGTAE